MTSWERSLGRLAGGAVPLWALSREFGEGWTYFEQTSDLVTLTRQGTAAWAKLTEHFERKAKADLDIRRVLLRVPDDVS
jgi:hypothetical protein